MADEFLLAGVADVGGLQRVGYAKEQLAVNSNAWLAWNNLLADLVLGGTDT